MFQMVWIILKKVDDCSFEFEKKLNDVVNKEVVKKKVHNKINMKVNNWGNDFWCVSCNSDKSIQNR